MRFLAPFWLMLSTLLMSGATQAAAADIYLFDRLKEPAFRKSWSVLVRNDRLAPVWVKEMANADSGFVTVPEERVTLNGKDYLLYFAGKQHDVGDNHAAFLFAADGSRAWAEIYAEGRRNLVLGEPTPDQRKALTRKLEE